MLERSRRLSEVRGALKRSCVVVLVGPRHAGETTLARQIVGPGAPGDFDLEDPTSLARLEPR
jgi:ABC-type phosphate/phosphonate transport system ATPase subunit